MSVIVKTDTPKQIADFLSTKQPIILRKFSVNEHENLPHLLCLGSGMMAARSEFSKIAHLHYTNLIDHQNQPFIFQTLANLIIEKLEHKPMYLAGYSIYGVLAVELAFQLEKLNWPLRGLILLDPPDFKRLNYLKRKKLFLEMRANLLGRWVNAGQEKWQGSYYYELRKLAIAKQPKRPLQSRSLTLYSKTKIFLNPWLEQQSQHQLKVLDFLGHLELVNTLEGI